MTGFAMSWTAHIGAQVCFPSLSPLIAVKKPSKVPEGSMNMCAFICDYSCEEIKEIPLPTAGQVQARHHGRLTLCMRGKQLNCRTNSAYSHGQAFPST